MQKDMFLGTLEEKKALFAKMLADRVSSETSSESVPDSNEESSSSESEIKPPESSSRESETSAIEKLRDRVKEFFRRFKQQIYFSGSRTLESRRISKLMPTYYRDESGEIQVKVLRTKEDMKKDRVALPDRYSIESIFPDTSKRDKSGNTMFTFQDRLFQFQEASETPEGFNTFSFCKEHVNQIVANYFGFPAPQTEVSFNGRYLVSRFIEGKELSEIPKNTLEFEYARQELKKRFVLDCLLGNIDESPLDLSAYKLGTDGKLYLTGKSNEIDASKPPVNLETLLESRKGHPIYGDLTDIEVYNQIRDIYKSEGEYYRFEQFLNENKRMGDNNTVSNFNTIISELHKRMFDLKKYRDNLILSSLEVQEEYLSPVTIEYFKKLDEIEIEGNPELKEAIKRNIIYSELIQLNRYETEASSRGISIEELKRQLQENITQAVEKSGFFRATDLKSFILILRTGRFKSQFETQSSHGFYSPTARSQTERWTFGFPEHSQETSDLIPKRPIYGYLSDNPDGLVKDSSLISYGEITLRLKERVRRKATILFEDSLNSAFPPTPALAPHFTSLPRIVESSLSTSDTSTYRTSYTEAQYHNQLLAIDIEEVIIREEALERIGKNNPQMVRLAIEAAVKEFNDQNPENKITIRYIK